MKFRAVLSYRVASPRKCLIRLKNRSTRLRCRYTHGLKAKVSLRMLRGGMFAQAPQSSARARIASVS